MIYGYCDADKQEHAGWWLRVEADTRCPVCGEVKQGWLCVTEEAVGLPEARLL